MPIEFSEIQKILGVLAKILAKGLTADQRITVLSDIKTPVISKTKDEIGFFQALLEIYRANNDLNFIMELAYRIQSTQSFYQDVGADLDYLNAFIKENKLDTHLNELQKPYVFVLMPFRPELFAIYQKAVRPVLRELGCVIETAKDVQTSEDKIMEIVFTQIARARFLIADTTGKNPNVFYEMGYAHALGKKVVILTQNPDDVPFDIKGLRYTLYSPDSLEALSQDIKWICEPLLR